MRSCRARPARANAQAMVVTLPWPLTTLPRCPVPQAARPSFAEKLVVLGARHRNESAARESTLGFRSAPDRPEREGTLQRVGFHECAAKAALRPLSTSIFRSSSLRQPISDVSYTIRDTLIEGFSHFVTSMTAPIVHPE